MSSVADEPLGKLVKVKGNCNAIQFQGHPRHLVALWQQLLGGLFYKNYLLLVFLMPK